MKEQLRDRIDVLMDKAKGGDAKAQLKLAREFKRGKLVEKSLEQAKYWAFKSVSAGYLKATSFYMSLY